MAFNVGSQYGFAEPDVTEKTLDRSRYPQMPETVRIKFDRLVQELKDAKTYHETPIMVLDRLNTAEVIDLNVIPLRGNNIQSPGDRQGAHYLMSTLAEKCGITPQEWPMIFPRLGHLETRMDEEDFNSFPEFVSFYIDTV